MKFAGSVNIYMEQRAPPFRDVAVTFAMVYGTSSVFTLKIIMYTVLYSCFFSVFLFFCAELNVLWSQLISLTFWRNSQTLLQAQFLIFTLVFGAVHIFTFCCLYKLKCRVPSSLLKEKWTVKIGNSKKNGLKNVHSFSLQPAEDPCG